MPAGRAPSDPIYQHRHPMVRKYACPSTVTDSDIVFQDIYTMLNEYCNIPIHHFIMAGITKEGKLVTFSGPQEAGNGKMLLERYIDLPGYLQWYTGTTNPSKNPLPIHLVPQLT